MTRTKLYPEAYNVCSTIKKRALLRVIDLYLTGLEIEVVVPNLKMNPDQLDHWHIVTKKEKSKRGYVSRRGLFVDRILL